jgi:TetR/AcrR family transcriptional regulator, mexJK operon transcriptional repressor
VPGHTSAGESFTGRSAEKHQAILTSGTRLFLRDGYRGTSIDQIAADAAVSKQTVYKHFSDKEQLFRAIVNGVTRNSDRIVAELATAFGDDPETRDQLEVSLRRLTRRWLDAVLQPHVLALRRLIIAEAEQFPDLAESYYRAAPARAIDVVAEVLGRCADRGLLSAPDPSLAAAHLAYLAVAIPQDRAQFIPGRVPSGSERDRLAAAATRVFLAGYAPAS